jgi:hypothetical protein
MKSKTLSYAAIAVALGVGGTVIASKIIGNGYKEDTSACKDQKADSDCGRAMAKALPIPAKVVPASATVSIAQPN